MAGMFVGKSGRLTQLILNECFIIVSAPTNLRSELLLRVVSKPSDLSNSARNRHGESSMLF